MNPAGLVVRSSDFDPRETIERALAAVTSQGMAIMARIDHAAGAAQAKLALPPTEVLIVGNPAAGTRLMQAAQTIGIDLPLKLLVWQDAIGKTWLGYNDPTWLADRHELGAEHSDVLEAMTQASAAIARFATTRSTLQ